MTTHILHSSDIMIPQKVRNNASIAYFFLGWLFLLAKKNPNFSESFVTYHSKKASKWHALFFLVYFVYSYFLSPFFSYSLPIVGITISHIIEIWLFVALTSFIISGVYATQKKGTVDITQDKDFLGQTGHTFEYQGASEAQRMILLLSHVPFFGMIIAKQHPNIVTTTGVRSSSVFSFIFICVFIAAGFWSLATITLFFGILVLVFLASRFFLSDRYTVFPWLEKIPSTENLYRNIRALPGYLTDVCSMIFGKRDTLSLESHKENIRAKDANLDASLRKYFTMDSLPFKPFWIFVPGINLVFIPKIFTERANKYVIAIGQGLIITLFAVIIGYFYGFTSSLELILLFPIFYGIASSDPFVRIPLVYEIYVVLNALTFGLLKNKRRLEEVQKQDQTVSFKL